MPSFSNMLAAGYGFSDPSVVIGAALEGATVHPEPKIRIPLAMMNRHGLVAGATGTGKTKTLQLLAEQLSAAGVAVFAADIKGDLSGIAMPGEANDRITTRAKSIGYEWKPRGVPTEFVSLTGKLGVFPVPPTVRLPMTTTGMCSRSDGSAPNLNSSRRKATSRRKTRLKGYRRIDTALSRYQWRAANSEAVGRATFMKARAAPYFVVCSTANTTWPMPAWRAASMTRITD